MELEVADFIIRNGRVIDPANKLNQVADVAIKDGKIVAVGKDLQLAESQEFDASGCLVTPGLIDVHTHVYQYATPLGVDVDKCCLAMGVTTVVDAGSAGSGNFPGLRKFIAEKCKTRVLAMLNIAAHGMAAAGCSGTATGGECDSLNQVDVAQCVQCIIENRDMIVGVKVRLSSSVTNSGLYEEEVYSHAESLHGGIEPVNTVVCAGQYEQTSAISTSSLRKAFPELLHFLQHRRALQASEKAQVPLMTHHTISTIPVQQKELSSALSCPGSLRPGDIYTHVFHGFESTVIDTETNRMHSTVHEARKRGVLFDVGHGRGSFSWPVAEACKKEGFFPDLISTDLHTSCHRGPAYDLPAVMTKFLHLGMPLFDVIKAVTMAPASAIGWSNVIGSLSIDHVADVTVLRCEDVLLNVEDCQAQTRQVHKALQVAAVWKEGLRYDVSSPQPLASSESLSDLACSWDAAVVKDHTRPTCTDVIRST